MKTMKVAQTYLVPHHVCKDGLMPVYKLVDGRWAAYNSDAFGDWVGMISEAKARELLGESFPEAGDGLVFPELIVPAPAKASAPALVLARIKALKGGVAALAAGGSPVFPEGKDSARYRVEALGLFYEESYERSSRMASGGLSGPYGPAEVIECSPEVAEYILSMGAPAEHSAAHLHDPTCDCPACRASWE